MGSQIIGSRADLNKALKGRLQIISDHLKEYRNGYFNNHHDPLDREAYCLIGDTLNDLSGNIGEYDLANIPSIEEKGFASESQLNVHIKHLHDYISISIENFQSLIEKYLKKEDNVPNPVNWAMDDLKYIKHAIDEYFNKIEQKKPISNEKDKNNLHKDYKVKFGDLITSQLALGIFFSGIFSSGSLVATFYETLKISQIEETHKRQIISKDDEIRTLKEKIENLKSPLSSTSIGLDKQKIRDIIHEELKRIKNDLIDLDKKLKNNQIFNLGSYTFSSKMFNSTLSNGSFYELEGVYKEKILEIYDNIGKISSLHEELSSLNISDYTIGNAMYSTIGKSNLLNQKVDQTIKLIDSINGG